MSLKVPIKKDSNNKKDARYIFIFFFDWGIIKTMHDKIRKVERTTKGIDKPSTPNENRRESLLNQEKLLTN